MSIKHLFASVAVALGTSMAMAMAQEITPETWASFDSVALPAPKSRAEVQAELEIYRRSGLAELERGDAVDTFGDRYRVASVRYAAMRNSPQFASLVRQLGGQPGASDVASVR